MQAIVAGLAAFVVAAVAVPRAQFQGTVDVVEVTATVTGSDGRFLTGLGAGDFVVREDGVPQRLVRASADREPISLGLLLDVSGSMDAGRIAAARAGIDRLLFQRLDPRDEVFFVEFSFNARLTQEWTTDRQMVRGALQDVRPTGDTALYDAVALGVPTAQIGRHRKKVLLVISDGRDTRSVVTIGELRDAVVASDVLVYALGFDKTPHSVEGADEGSLRRMTDVTGGRTEMVRRPEELTAAVDRISDELGRQCQLAYERSGPRDGRPRAIKVEVRRSGARVRARQAYVPD